MKKVKFFVLVLLVFNFVFAEKVADLPEVMEPPLIHIQKNRAYIKEGKTIHIYSFGDFKHIKQFGREGEGPGEFKHKAELSVYPDKLIVNTYGKLIYFSPDGTFMKELKIPGRDFMNLFQVGEHFVCSAGVIKKDKPQPLKAINVYDKQFDVIKNIHTGSLGQTMFFESGVSKKQDLLMVRDMVEHHVYKDNIYFFNTTKGFYFAVYDSAGKLLYEADRKYRKIKVSEAYKKGRMRLRQAEPRWDRYKRMFNFVFPDYFPAFHKVKFSDDKIYFVTYDHVEKKDAVILTDLKGKFLRKSAIPVDPYKRIYAFTIHKDKVYSLIENEDKEMWEVHTHEL